MTAAQKNFINTVGPMARADMAKSGVLASLTIAQAILESRSKDGVWGASRLATEGKALFGIKAETSWKGKRINLKTFEVINGKTVEIYADFRAYDSWEESVVDHGAFLRGLARYKAVIGETDYKKACRAIKAAGYATGPDYAEVLIGLIERYGLTAWDGVQNTPTPEKPVQGPAEPQERAYFTYTIKSGADTMWALACRYLGSGARWTEIQALNGGIKPESLRLGQVIKIPKT